MSSSYQDSKRGNKHNILVVGASFAGLTTAIKLSQLGHKVTVVESSSSIKRGGTPIDIKKDTKGLLEEMNLLQEVIEQSLPKRKNKFVTQSGAIEGILDIEETDEADAEYEVDRDSMLKILLTMTEKLSIDVQFNKRLCAIRESENDITARFMDGSEQSYSLLLGCDGMRSMVRRSVFGPDEDFVKFLGVYFSISIVDELCDEKNVTEICSAPGKTTMLNSYTSKSDVIFFFHSENEISYDYKNIDEQKNIIIKQFENFNTSSKARFNAMNNADNFYFDKICQVKMDSWSKERIALVGDAGYCASPASGMGGSLAIIGACHFAKAFEKCDGELSDTFEEYERTMRPVVDMIQTQAVEFGIETFIPSTEESIQKRNAMMFGD